MKGALTTCFSKKNASEALNLRSTCEYGQIVSLYSKVRSGNTRIITQRARIKPKLRALNIPCVLVDIMTFKPSPVSRWRTISWRVNNFTILPVPVVSSGILFSWTVM